MSVDSFILINKTSLYVLFRWPEASFDQPALLDFSCFVGILEGSSKFLSRQIPNEFY